MRQSIQVRTSSKEYIRTRIVSDIATFFSLFLNSLNRMIIQIEVLLKNDNKHNLIFVLV